MTGLPFPAPLDRSTFLTPTFNAADFLASLTARFQTVEDLQTELQDLLKALSKELVDLVNDNYTDFLSLGDKLKGGEDRIEEIRVGLLGFQRDVTGVRALIQQRSSDIQTLLQEKREVRKQIRNARNLLEIDERLEELESQLDLVSTHDSESTRMLEITSDEKLVDFGDWPREWLQDSSGTHTFEVEGDSDEAQIPTRIATRLQKFQAVQLLASKCGEQSPFVLAQRDRVSQIKDALAKDFEVAIRNQPDVRVKQQIIRMRSQLDE